MADEYLVNIVLKARDEGMKAFAEMNVALAEMVAASKLANEELRKANELHREHSGILSHMALDGMAVVAATERMADSLASKLTPAMNNSNAASRGAQSGFMGFINAIVPGGATAAAMAVGITEIAVVLAPLTMELAASLILLGAWVVGATAFLTVIGIAAAGVLALAGGIAFLGIQQMGGLNPAAALTKAQTQLTTATNQASAAQEAVNVAALRYNTSPTAMNALHLQQAQEALTEAQQKQVDAQNAVNTATTNANGPMGVLRQSIQDMATTLGQAAVPMTTQMLQALIPLVPQVQAAGQALIDWFGPRLPAVLVIAGQAFGNLLAGVERLAAGWGQLIDHVLARSPEFGNIINGAFNRVIDGALGLLDNLVKLSDWFVARLPVLGANANSTFANLGIAVQLLGAGLGNLVDWIIAHWPAINAMFDASWNAFKQGWGVVQPILMGFAQNLKDLAPLFQYIQDHADNLKVIYWALGAAAGLVVAALAALFVIAVLLTGAIVGLGDAVHGSLDALHSAADSVGGAWNGAKDNVSKALDAIIGKHQSVGQSAKDAATVVNTATGDMQGDWRKTAGPGTGSIDESTTKINTSIAGVRGTSATTSDQIQTDNRKTLKSSQDTSTGLTGAWEWVARVVTQSTHDDAIAFGGLRDVINKSMGDNIGAIDAFEQEHLKTAGSHERLNTQEGAMFTWLSKTIGQSMSDNGAAVEWFTGRNATHSADIERTNRQQGINWQELGRIIGKSMDENGQWLSNFGIQVKRLSDFTDYVVFHVMGPAFSDLGRSVREMGKAVGDAFSGMGAGINSGLHKVADVINAFGTAVTGALGTFGVKMAAVKFAEGGVIPGYAPGQDSVLAMLSPGEGVLTPQTVRAMGGASAIAALNEGTDRGAGAFSIGAIGGQCVEFLQNLLGLTFHGDAHNWVGAPYAHTQVGAPGELAVFTGGWYGHLALVTKMITDSVFEVLDSNWVAPGIIGRHVMDKGMYGFATFLNPGVSAPGGLGQFLSGIPGITSPADLLNGLVGKALGGLGGWEGDLAKGILGQAVTGITHKLGFDSGGGLPPGGTFAWNGSGRTETVTPASTMDRVENLLAQVVAELRQLNGQPRLGAQLALARVGG